MILARCDVTLLTTFLLQTYVVQSSGEAGAQRRRLSVEMFAHGTAKSAPSGPASATLISDTDAWLQSVEPYAGPAQ